MARAGLGATVRGRSYCAIASACRTWTPEVRLVEGPAARKPRNDQGTGRIRRFRIEKRAKDATFAPGGFTAIVSAAFCRAPGTHWLPSRPGISEGSDRTD